MRWCPPSSPLVPKRERAFGEHGLTIVEVTVALLVVMLAAVALAMVLSNGVLAVSLSQQSQTASNIAESVVAQAEALPWSTLEEGLSSSDTNLALDEGPGGNVGPAASGNYYCYEGMPLFIGTGGGESPLASATTAPQCPTVPTAQGGPGWPWQDVNWSAGPCYQGLGAEIVAAAQPDVPLASHAVCVEVNHTRFIVVVYPTVAPISASSYPPTAVEVSVVVTWSNGTSTVSGRTRVTNSVVLTQCRVNGTWEDRTQTLVTQACPQ